MFPRALSKIISRGLLCVIVLIWISKPLIMRTQDTHRDMHTGRENEKGFNATDHRTTPVPLTSRPNTKKVKILCWILADPNVLQTKVVHQKVTWGKRCEKLLVMSSKEDKDFPAIGLANTKEGRGHIEFKSKLAWKYIYEHYINSYDFFVKVDTDTYLVVENLLEFLSDKDPTKPHYYGHLYTPKNWNLTYPAGGPGVILTQKTLRLLVTEALVKHEQCWPYNQAEDVAIGKCLTLVGGIAQETRDQEGKERLIVFDVGLSIHGYFPEWYITWHEKRGALKGSQCCSDYPISFHYVNKENIYALEYWLYHAKVHGYENSAPPWPQVKTIENLN